MPSVSRSYFDVRTRLFDTASSKDSFDMDELKQRIIQAEQQSPFADLFQGLQSTTGSSAIMSTPQQQQQQKNEKPNTVYIVSFQQFGVQRGVHSIEYPKGSGNNVVLAFTSKKACDKFANTLRAQHFFDPTVRSCVCVCDTLLLYFLEEVQKSLTLYFSSCNSHVAARNVGGRSFRVLRSSRRVHAGCP